MSSEYVIKEELLKISNLSMELFDSIDEEGVEIVLDKGSSTMKLKELVDTIEKIRLYYFQRATRRLIALGISPQELFDKEGARE